MNESELKTALNELKTDRAQFDYVMERSSNPSIENSLKQVGRSKGWFYGLPKERQELLETLANELHFQAKLKAQSILEQAIEKAAEVKVSGLVSRNENIKQSSASEILDRNLGKATQKTEIAGTDGNALKILVEYADSQTNPAATPLESE